MGSQRVAQYWVEKKSPSCIFSTFSSPPTETLYPFNIPFCCAEPAKKHHSINIFCLYDFDSSISVQWLSCVRLFAAPWTVHDPARQLEWIANLFSRGSSQHRDKTQVSCIAGKFFTVWAMRDKLKPWLFNIKSIPMVSKLSVRKEFSKVDQESMIILSNFSQISTSCPYLLSIWYI